MANENTESTGKTIQEVSSAIQQASKDLEQEAEGASQIPATPTDEDQASPEDGAVVVPEPAPKTPEEMQKNPMDLVDEEIMKQMGATTNADVPDGDAESIGPRTLNDVVRDIRSA
jgi:cytoskeletal protein RodZ